ncbi:MAG: MFS transporter [Acidobacteriota bacterium]|nr:MFS transporter [Acidobacteriota bacterium]
MWTESKAEHVEPTRLDKRAVAVLSLGHLVNDAYSSTIYPLLPLLAAQLRLSEVQVFFLVPTLSLTAAFLQPLYGFISDRYSRRMFAVLGPAVTGIFMSLIGVASSYWLLLLCLFFGGIGGGAFHPQAASLVSQSGGERRRVAVSIFTSAGTLGVAIGPLMIAYVVGDNDLSKTVSIIGFGVIISLFLYLYCPPMKQSPGDRPKTGFDLSFLTNAGARGPLIVLYAVSLSRASLHLLIANFLPFILRDQGYSLQAIGGAMSAFLLAGALGSFLGGALAERFGERKLNALSGLLTTVFICFGLFLPGILGLTLFLLGTASLMSVIAVNVTQAQELAPSHTSTVSAMLMGFVWGVGSLSVPLIGPFAATWGFRPVLLVMAVGPLLTGLWALKLRESRTTRRARVDDVSVVVSAGAD